MDGRIGSPLHWNTHAGDGKFLENWGMTEPKWYCGVMVEAAKGFRLHLTSILYLYKVFQHLDMLWMGIWVHPYTVIPLQVTVNFSKIEVQLSLNGIVVSWSRLQTALDYIPHPYYMYTKCLQSVLAP